MPASQGDLARWHVTGLRSARAGCHRVLWQSESPLHQHAVWEYRKSWADPREGCLQAGACLQCQLQPILTVVAGDR